MGVKVTNNGFGTISAGITSSATTVVLDSGQGARFPTLASGDFFFGTLVDTSNNIEIVKVTARSSDSMTVVRGQDNTSARAFSVGDRFELRPTAALFESLAASAITWQSSIKTSSFTAIAGEAYWVDTSSNTVTITLPSSASVGDMIELVDYARNWGTNKIIIDSNGLNYQGQADTYTVEYDTSGQGLRIIYSGATKGWIPTSDDVSEDNPVPPTYNVNTLVIAGGGAGGNRHAGGGGAGGMLVTNSVTLTSGTQYTITVGAGGSGTAYDASAGNNGVNSTITGSGLTTLTAFGGGGGGIFHNAGHINGQNGGSGGGGGSESTGGTGTSGQGNNGGNGGGQSAPDYGGAGGGGAGAVGGNGSASAGGAGGAGSASSITGSSVTYAGGGGGSSFTNNSAGGAGGSGGGATGTGHNVAGNNGTANTGGGGGGNTYNGALSGGGGSGVIIISVPTANYSGTTTGSPNVATSGSNKILTFTGSGSYTA